MPTFEIFDTVVLKTDETLIGTVERVSGTPDTYEPLDDRLIIAHVEVPVPILTEFVTSGVPPRGYVFVQFAYEENGSSLVPEDNIRLVSRSLDIGEHVKGKESLLTGTITSVSESYTLQPVCTLKVGESLSRASFTQYTSARSSIGRDPQNLPDQISHLPSESLLFDIPGHELRGAQDILEGGTVICRDWVGTVDEVDIDVVIALEDGSIVVVSDPYDLHLPIPELEKPLVSMPEHDNVRRPDFLVALQGWGTTMPMTDPQPGAFVVTSRSSLRDGRWIKGSHNPLTAPQGVVLDVITRDVGVAWLTCNAFAPKQTKDMKPPPPTISIYENSKTYCTAADLRRKKDVTIYDPSRRPNQKAGHLSLESRLEPTISVDLQHSKTKINISGPSQDFRVGDNVRFRDEAGAAVKYQRGHAGTHGYFNRIPPASTFGWNLNEFRIVSVRQKATVLWQDGNTSSYESRELRKFVLFESELTPTDIVLNREGMKQRLSRKSKDVKSEITDFNETKAFEQPHDLLPRKVGIVQSVNHTDRIARIRWYDSPNIQLLEAGTVLSPKSRFGPIGDVVEDVSLYEIMTFPALQRHLTDMVIIPPDSDSKHTLEAIRSNSMSHVKPSDIPPRIAASYRAGHLLLQAQNNKENIPRTGAGPEEVQAMTTKTTNDWIGDIVALGLDGSITVRLCGADWCRDVVIGHDEIIAIINDDEDFLDEDDIMDLDSFMSDDTSDNLYHSASVISRSIEYEGGERLDNDSDDENWMSETEDSDSEKKTRAEEGEDTEMKDRESMNLDNEQTIPDARLVSSEITKFIPQHVPQVFEILEEEPPSDQFRRDFTLSSNGSFLKRVLREHQILSSSLPQGEIFVRTYESRLDLMRCLITGPRDTPYEYAPFMIDLHLGTKFPQEPPTAHFHSWTSGLGRINPNLYEEGKICLSLLGTWPGKTTGENWTEKATILQILISLQGLILVRKPFYNEAGFEGLENEKVYEIESLQYTEKAFVIARGFIKHALLQPPASIEAILAWLYLRRNKPEHSCGLLQRVLQQGKAVIERSEAMRNDGNETLVDGKGDDNDPTAVYLRPLSKGAVVMLKRIIKDLEDAFPIQLDIA